MSECESNDPGTETTSKTSTSKTSNGTADSSSNSKYKMSESLREKLQSFPDALAYIELLEDHVKKQKKKLSKLKAKLKRKAKHKSVHVQTEESFNSPLPNKQAKEAKSLAEEIKEAAEEATQNSGFLYDEVSGLYYDQNTGYYYNAEYGLYYDSSNGTYLTYKAETNTYEFHSQVALPQHATKAKRKTKRLDKTAKAKKRRKSTNDSSNEQETEEGECSGSDTEIECLSSGSESDTSDLAKQWPPCMRLIVEQSTSPKIKVGALHILTFEGGTLGREGDHSIILPDLNISKSHLKFVFSKEKDVFLATDLGSRNGTVLNGKRMSSSQQESESMEVAHGSRLQIGPVTLLCHVHEGNQTCGHCEPGLVQVPEKSVIVPTIDKMQVHKTELKNLRKKFGVSAFEEGKTRVGPGYTDRAQKRRVTVGSQNPHEKTEVASVNESIGTTNKGFKMLSKMGWKEGESLGKDNQGVLEPVQLVANSGTSGMGNNQVTVSTKEKLRLEQNKEIIWKKTQERFTKLSSTNIFEVDSD